MIQKAEKYIGKFLETNKDFWYTSLVGSNGKAYQHWGVAAVKALFEWKELESIASPVAGCFALIKDSDGHEWAGIVTENCEDGTVRVIEFGTTPNYNLTGSEYGYGVYRKRRKISAYADFCVVKTTPSVASAQSVAPIHQKVSKMKTVSKDAPPSQSLADKKQPINEGQNR